VFSCFSFLLIVDPANFQLYPIYFFSREFNARGDPVIRVKNKLARRAGISVLHFRRIPPRHVNRSGFIKAAYEAPGTHNKFRKKANHVRPSFRANQYSCVRIARHETTRFTFPRIVFIREKRAIPEFSCVEKLMRFHFSTRSRRGTLTSLFIICFDVYHVAGRKLSKLEKR